MRDPETFEPRFAAAVGRYLQDAPMEVDAVALAHATAVASRQAGTRRFLTMNTALRFVLIGAIAGAALVGISLAGGQKVTAPLPSPSPCATPAADSSPALAASPMAVGSAAGAAPIEFLWSATGPADDPISFAVASGFIEGGHVAMDSTCKAWVADTGHSRFAIFGSDGAFAGYWGSRGTEEGQFYLVNGRGESYGDIAFAPDGSFYVLDVGNYRVQHFDKDRTFLASWGSAGTDPGRFVDPAAIAVDAMGLVYVLDASRDVVEKYDEAGNVLGSFKPGLLSLGADDLKIDGHGDIYMSVGGNNPKSGQEVRPEWDAARHNPARLCHGELQ